MMAAFIIAVRGTVKQAILLGLCATLSHTAIVWIIALGGMVVEIVDEEAKLRRFAEALADLPDIGLMTLEAVEVLTPAAISA